MKAYPVIGGPLDGEYACTKDFDSDGMYAHLSGTYAQYNFGWVDWRRDKGTHVPSMVFLSLELTKPVISAKNR